MSYIVKQSTPFGAIHVHLATSFYIKEKKCSRNTREYLGKLDSKGTELILGSKTKEPTKEIIELLKAKKIDYAGKKSTGPGQKKRTSSILKSKSSSLTVREIGGLKAFRHLSKEIGLTASLQKGFGSKLSDKLIELAIFQACENAPLYLAEIWAYDVGLGQGFSSSSITRITTEIGNKMKERDSFYKSWFIACGNPKSLIHDTTSISTYSKKINDSEWGYNRDKEKLKQINMALVVSEEKQLPLWYRIIPGSIPDVSTLKITGDILKSLGLSGFSYSLDRGYYSNTNLQAMFAASIDFTIGVPLQVSKAQKIIKTSHKNLMSPKSSFLYNGKRMRSVDSIFSVELPNKEIKEITGTLFYDPDRQELSASHFEKIILELEEKAGKEEFKSSNNANEWILDNAAGKLSNYLRVKKIMQKWTVIRKPNLINKAIRQFGLALVVSSLKKTSSEQTLNNYRSRDIAEKIFNIVKNDVGEKRIKTGKSKNVNGRLFIAFIAAILRASFQNKLRESNLLKTFSVNEAVALLSKIRQIKLSDDTVQISEIPKKTKIIQKAIGFEI